MYSQPPTLKQYPGFRRDSRVSIGPNTTSTESDFDCSEVIGNILGTSDTGWYDVRDRCSDPFDLVRISLTDGAESAEEIGQFLLHGLADTDYLASLMSRHGYQRVAQYIKERRIPTRLNIRVADFGEVVSGRLLEEEEGLIRPIEKLRYKFNHDWSPHLTDVFAVLVEGDEITTFAYCEVKAGTTPPNVQVGANGYRDLIKVPRDKTPEILYFTAERLWEAGRLEDYDRLDRAMSSATPIPNMLRLALVFDESAWSESVLDAVKNAMQQEGPTEASFVCFLVTRDGLRTLVEESFDKMREALV